MESKKTILAIDDQVFQLKLFEEILLPKYKIELAKSASDALHYLNTSEADLILLDIEMPNINGFEFLNDIKAIPSYMETPVIIVSANSGADFLKKARNSSAVDVLIKPVSADILIQSIEKAFA
jgi:CheY-like chemotaxis protein